MIAGPAVGGLLQAISFPLPYVLSAIMSGVSAVSLVLVTRSVAVPT